MKSGEILELLPEHAWISSDDLRMKCLDTWVKAAEEGTWDLTSLKRLPFVLTELKDCPVTLVEHVRNVARLAAGICRQFTETYSQYVHVNTDVVVSGALLHDVGKLIEYSCCNSGFVPSSKGRLVRHPLAGAIVAESCGVPAEVVHIIATHSFEGERSFRSPEALIVRTADWMNFDFLAFRFPSRMSHQ